MKEQTEVGKLKEGKYLLVEDYDQGHFAGVFAPGQA